MTAQKPAAQIVAAPDQNGSDAIPAAREDNVIEADAPPVPDEVVLIDGGARSEDALFFFFFFFEWIYSPRGQGPIMDSI